MYLRTTISISSGVECRRGPRLGGLRRLKSKRTNRRSSVGDSKKLTSFRKNQSLDLAGRNGYQTFGGQQIVGSLISEFNGQRTDSEDQSKKHQSRCNYPRHFY